MTRVLSSRTAAVVSWIAREMIYLGQTIIKTAYEWLKWADRL